MGERRDELISVSGSRGGVKPPPLPERSSWLIGSVAPCGGLLSSVPQQPAIVQQRMGSPLRYDLSGVSCATIAPGFSPDKP